MKKIYWKEVFSENTDKNILKNILSKGVVFIKPLKKITIKFNDKELPEKIEVCLSKKDIEEYLNNND